MSGLSKKDDRARFSNELGSNERSSSVQNYRTFVILTILEKMTNNFRGVGLVRAMITMGKGKKMQRYKHDV